MNSTPATTATTDREGPNQANPPRAPISNSSATDDTKLGEDVFDVRWLEKLSVDVHENTEERINLQRALFELEDVAIQSRCELASVEDRLVELEMTGRRKSPARSTNPRRSRFAIVAGDWRMVCARGRPRRDGTAPPWTPTRARGGRSSRGSIARRANPRGKPPAFLRILSQYRTRGVSSMEAHFQLAVRDGVLADQRDVIGCMWRMLAAAGVSRERAVEAAKREGVFAAFDGSELNLGEDSGWSTYSLERETVVGARAAARLAFWQSYGAVDDLSVGTGKHPHVPAPTSEHHHHHHQHHQSNHPQHHHHHQRDHQREPPRAGARTRIPHRRAPRRRRRDARQVPARATVPDHPAPAYPTQLSPRDRSARALAKLRDRGGSGRRKSVESIQYSEGSRPVSSSGVSAGQVSDSAYPARRRGTCPREGTRLAGRSAAPAQLARRTFTRSTREWTRRSRFARVSYPRRAKRGAPPIAASAYKTLAVGGTRASLGSLTASGGGGGGGGG